MEVSMDLSLARVLCVVYEAGSVSRAADALCLSQPAVSHALGRLRREVMDPLFIRTATGMMPTPRAGQLYLKFREALRLVEQAIEEVKVFDAGTSTRRFRLSMSDIGVMVFLPPILDHLQAEAPDMAIDIRQVTVPELLRSLEIGQIDLALGNLPDLQEHTRHNHLFTEHYVSVLREGHGSIRNGLSLKTFLTARHVAVTSPFSGHRMVEDMLVQQGVSRHIVLETPHFTSVPDIIARTDLIVTVPSRVAKLFAVTHGLRCLPLPVAVPSFAVRMYWHERSQTDQGHTWMRDVVTRLLSAL
jgi:DNA-binding transcriptional LysR family regulator